jgi:hypothetical protein
LTADNVGPKRTIGPSSIAFQADVFGRVHHNSYGKAVVFAGVLYQSLSVFRAYVGRVNYCELSTREPLLEHVVKSIESVRRSGLVVFVITD